MTPSQAIGYFITAVILGLCAWFWFNSGIFGKMQVIVARNWFFWILIFGGLFYAGFRRWRNPEGFTLGEIPVQIGGSTIVLWLLCTFFFYQTSDLKNREVWNGYVTNGEYEEYYEDRVCTESCDSEGNNCHEDCSCIGHGPNWYLHTSNGETVPVSEGQYGNLKGHFGNEVRTGYNGDIACTTGDVYETRFNGGRELLIPSAHEHLYVDYLQASASIRKTTGGNTTGFENLLRPYPRVTGGYFGSIYIDRVVTAGVQIPADMNKNFERWKGAVDQALDIALSDLGKRKEVNILVYLVGTPDQKFLQALEEAWVHGKKNDVVVIIGTTKFPKVDWVEIMLRGDYSEELKIKLRNRIREAGNINDGAALAAMIINQVALPPEQGGFKRTPMSEMSYLAADVEISTGAMILILAIWAFLTWLLSWALENNEIREWTSRKVDRLTNWRRY